ncbi:MAG: N-formylglutamate amidohydrolase [Polyangiaceae bacterium]|nr:N-formylglutamate amidohydrolase [Polyangiaceae bacterium]
MKPATFSLVEPDPAIETPLVVEVPHAGLRIDHASIADMAAPIRCIGRDADLLVDALVEGSEALGATVLVADYSRYVIDLNRGPNDYDGLSVDGGPHGNLPRGLVWRTSTDGDPILARRLPKSELERRLATFYRPYHAALMDVLERKKQRFGHAILLCAHSMPSQGRRGHVDVGAGRADVVPGSRGRTTARGEVIDTVDRVARSLGFSVKHDDPYKGGFSTGHYGKPSERIDAVQVELARRLYLDEERLTIVEDGFARTQALVHAWVKALGCLAGGQ